MIKKTLIIAASLLCLHSHAAITQQHVIVDSPVVSVRQGEQDNGNIAIEQLFTNNTTSAQDSLAGSIVSFARSSSFGGTPVRGAPTAFASLSDVSSPQINPPIGLLPNPVNPPGGIKPNPVIPAVPEPETYAMMGIGLMGLLLARRQRAKR